MVKKVMLISGILIVLLAVVLAFTIPANAGIVSMSKMERLGKMLFLDKRLSINNNQSCATCHAEEFGFTGPKGKVNAHGSVYPGSIPTEFGNRKPPTAAYGGESPLLYYDDSEEVWVGGMFWDGRATGWILGDPLAEQAKGPFLNPAEQALPDADTLCLKVSMSHYAKLFKQVWGSLDCSTSVAVEQVYDRIGLSISAYEKSSEVNPFNSKFDGFWNNAVYAGMDVTQINTDNYEDYYSLGLSDEEVLGLALFNDVDKGKCSLCHTLDVGEAGYPLFTDFTYDNLGIPKNLENPVYVDDPGFIDLGLGGFLGSEAEWGKFKVPTLRNVDKREDNTIKAYGHNGFFKSLYDITHFYNTRDVLPWPEPEYAATVNHDELGDLGLTVFEENAIVLFMQTLTDNTVSFATVK
jgi:cytochrome c peroxidase